VYWHPADAPLTEDDRRAITRTHLTIITYDPDMDPEVLAATQAIVLAGIQRIAIESIPRHCKGVSMAAVHRVGPVEIRLIIDVASADGAPRVHPQAFYWLKLREPKATAGELLEAEPTELTAPIGYAFSGSDPASGSFSRSYVVVRPSAGPGKKSIELVTALHRLVPAR
jgi:hypothetical protein